jgi:hypothetical protein
MLFFRKKNCYKKLSKFEQYFELVSRIVKLKILTRKTTDKNTTWKWRKLFNNLFKQNNSVAMVTIALPIFENIPI